LAAESESLSLSGSRFQEALAIDISQECLTQPRVNSYDNILYKRADLTKTRLLLPQAILFFAVVIMLTEVKQNEAMIRNLKNPSVSTGVAVVVVPLSIHFLFYFRLMEWYRKRERTAAQIPTEDFSYYKGINCKYCKGLMKISGVPTKNYLREELECCLPKRACRCSPSRRWSMNGNSEILVPADWLQGPIHGTGW